MKDTARRADLLKLRSSKGLIAMSQYRDNKVSQDQVRALRKDLDDAPVERKIGRWGAYRHSSTLYRHQNQGYHHHYLNFDGVPVCTCGLQIVGDELVALHYPNENLDLQPLQMVEGHRNLPECEGVTVALIVKFRFDWGLNDYLWTAYCQVCGTSVVEVTNAAAKEFVAEHNQSCQR